MARLKKKIFNNRHNPKIKHFINQLLYTTSGLIIWWTMQNGFRYHISYYCGKMTKMS